MKYVYYKVMRYRLTDGKRVSTESVGTVDGPLRNAREQVRRLRDEGPRTEEFEYGLRKVIEEVVE